MVIEIALYFIFFLLVVCIMHPDNFNKDTASKDDIQGVMQVNVRKIFTNKHEFIIREHIFHWLCSYVSKSEFDIVIGSPVLFLIEDIHLLR